MRGGISVYVSVVREGTMDGVQINQEVRAG